ncbi:hypothetical protein GCM10027605_75230 [Micromonospora zhanjiangensis]
MVWGRDTTFSNGEKGQEMRNRYQLTTFRVILILRKVLIQKQFRLVVQELLVHKNLAFTGQEIKLPHLTLSSFIKSWT